MKNCETEQGLRQKKRNECWRRDCHEKIILQARIKMDLGKAFETWEMRGCRKHFGESWVNYQQAILNVINEVPRKEWKDL